MAEPSLSAPALDALQNGTSHSRRPRPPDPVAALDHENRIPLKPESGRMRRRESRLGLINIFARQKSSVDLTAPGPSTASSTVSTQNSIPPSSASSSRDQAPARTGGIRASLAEISSWPYSQHNSRSDAVPSPAPSQRQQQQQQQHRHEPGQKSQAAPGALLGSATLTPQSRPARAPVGAKGKSSGSPPQRPGRGALATWDPPPLFQAYPQAIRHIELPACTMSAESILRLHGNRAGQGASLIPDSDTSLEKGADKPKRKHRRNASSMASFKPEWTTKVYVLVTSGYLLQYSGEGSFDRLPEKILQLSKDSAAFASDLIPGRHWVLQVSAVMEADGTSTVDSRSLLSRLPFRGPERRQASLFLMVFEGAEEMDQWIAILRREIEHLGGKKNLSETGKPKADDAVLQLRGQPSQRALVLRDPGRFSRSIVPEQLAWGHDRAVVSATPATPATPETPDILLDSPELDATPDRSFDDVSTTNSFASHNERQLDNLREGSQRLSFVSSGQRTVVTSDGSSPSCSPTRDSFSSHREEPPLHPETLQPDVQRRPNAHAILERRKSMQTINPAGDLRAAPQRAPPRPASTCHPDASAQPHASKPLTTPNFSVPHSVSKRFSIVKSIGSPEPPALSEPLASVAVVAPPPPPPPPPLPNRPPPPPLGLPRPLSIVADQPSPISPQLHHPGRRNRHEETERSRKVQAPDSPAIFEAWGQRGADVQIPPAVPPKTGLSPRRASLQLVMRDAAPRRHASVQALRTRSPGLATHRDAEGSHVPQHVALTAKPPAAERLRRPVPRAVSGTDFYERRRSPPRLGFSVGEGTASLGRNSRRASMMHRHHHHAPAADATGASGMDDPDAVDWRVAPHPPLKDAQMRPLPPPPPPVRAPPSQPQTLRSTIHKSTTSTQHLGVVSDPKTLLNRHSIPQLAGGPPPAPPPTCALPPIPPMNRGSEARQLRAPSIQI